MLKSFKKNSLGKDYVCSDIHGHFSILQAALDTIGFNEHCDRLFSLGDLIDRGDESHLALEWLAKPWFFAIQGNHERMLINTVERQSKVLRNQWMMWGGRWAESMDDEALAIYCEAFSKLPLAIEIELPYGELIGLVHAELPNECDWAEVRNLLIAIEPSRIEVVRQTSDMLWNRNQPLLSAEELPKVKPVKNISHVFHGHTIVENYLTITNRTFMDLGAYQTGEIGLIQPTEFFGQSVEIENSNF